MQRSSYSLLKLYSYQLQTWWKRQVAFTAIDSFYKLPFWSSSILSPHCSLWPLRQYSTSLLVTLPNATAPAILLHFGLMLILTSSHWCFWRRGGSGREKKIVGEPKRDTRLSFSLPDPARRRPPSFSIVSTDRELEQATLMRSVIFFSLHWLFSLIFNDDNRYSHVDVYNYFLACNYFLAERMDQSTPH